MLVMPADLFRLFDEVRLLNHQLVRTVEALHSDIEVSASGRAVLEFLRHMGPTSVPEIARGRLVSRQHIQTIVDDLGAAGHVERSDNPAHRRSPLVNLTTSGAALMALMHQRESDFVEQRSNHLDPTDIAAASQLLAAVRETLDQKANL
jgi:DNA-binding MarR family transcriptional regulator